jgi:HEPN domain-containing protein
MIDSEVKKWLIKAMNDYRTAEKLIQGPEEDVITDTLCFHGEQFVEKVLKAYLLSHQVDFKRTHNLEYLVKLSSERDQEFQWLDEVAEKFTEYAVEVRYPDAFYIPSLAEAQEAFEIIRRVKEFVFGKLGIRDEDVKNRNEK